MHMHSLDPRDATIVAGPAPERITVKELNFYYGQSRALKNITSAALHQSRDRLHRPVGLRQVHAAARF